MAATVTPGRIYSFSCDLAGDREVLAFLQGVAVSRGAAAMPWDALDRDAVVFVSLTFDAPCHPCVTVRGLTTAGAAGATPVVCGWLVASYDHLTLSIKKMAADDDDVRAQLVAAARRAI